MAAQQPRPYELVVIADPDLMRDRAAAMALDVNFREYRATQAARPDQAHELCIDAVALTTKSIPGKLDPANAGYVLQTLERAVDGCASGEFSAMVTGPVHKGVINDSGVEFTGHTEFIADRTDSQPVMMLAAGKLRVALATTHLPLAQVASSITREGLTQTLQILHRDMQSKFNITDPHILVCGLNPHAGEDGHLGSEEITTITPVIEQLRSSGMRLTGPLPADTLFTPRHLDGCDAVLAMFHDQGLPVLKYAGFGSAVNLTLGLPIIRTSVDHGTAIDLAASGNIEHGSLLAALQLAHELAS